MQSNLSNLELYLLTYTEICISGIGWTGVVWCNMSYTKYHQMLDTQLHQETIGKKHIQSDATSSTLYNHPQNITHLSNVQSPWLTFHCTYWFIGILKMAYQHPYNNWVGWHSLKKHQISPGSAGRLPRCSFGLFCWSLRSVFLSLISMGKSSDVAKYNATLRIHTLPQSRFHGLGPSQSHPHNRIVGLIPFLGHTWILRAT